MEKILLLLGITAVIVVNALIAFVLGWLLTEVVRIPLSFKPFNCRPCLTFWFTVLFNCIFATVAAPYVGVIAAPLPAIYGVSGAGVLCGFINFLYIKLKFQIYD